MMKLNFGWLTAAGCAIALSLLAGTLSAPSRAVASPKAFCRDCPFPAKIADGRWLMPNGILQLEIDEEEMPGHMSHVDVVLRDVRSGAVVARGFINQRKYRKTLFIEMTDNHGRLIKGFVRYVDDDHDEIQARFTCEQCSIGSMLE